MKAIIPTAIILTGIAAAAYAIRKNNRQDPDGTNPPPNGGGTNPPPNGGGGNLDPRFADVRYLLMGDIVDVPTARQWIVQYRSNLPDGWRSFVQYARREDGRLLRGSTGSGSPYYDAVIDLLQ